MFNEERVAQMAAFLLSQQGGHMSYLKLMKLLYLSDREAMSRFGESISGDLMVSMPHGPVLSQTLNLIKSGGEQPDGWNEWISGEANYEVATRRRDATRDDFDLLTDIEVEILTRIWHDFGHMGKWDLVNYTHDNCAEWQDPKGSAYPIKEEALFMAVGKTPDVAVALAQHLREQRQLDEITSRLR
ncbi:Panacea domain-containing protein [Aeromonas veronii]|uniref:Panacea domain-containing protein n=1 Tax=Aeromonas veronii TaxID=654 RepID=UPI003A1E21A1